jgi:hypothetical protein
MMNLSFSDNNTDKRVLVLRIFSGLILILGGAFVIGCDDYCDDCRVFAVNDTPPDAPQGVYSVTGDHAVYIYWIANPANDRISYYWVWRSTEEMVDNQGRYYTRYAKAYQDSYVDRSVRNGKTYYYAVTAVDIDGWESEDLSEEFVFDTPRPEGSGVVLQDFRTHPEASGFYFKAHRVLPIDDSRTDIFFEYDPDYQAFFVWATWENDSTWTDIQDFGYTDDLSELDWAPDQGWSDVGWMEAILGHSYYVWTDDNHYAKFRIDDLNYAARRVTISWAYQEVPGYPELMPQRNERKEIDKSRIDLTKFATIQNSE